MSPLVALLLVHVAAQPADPFSLDASGAEQAIVVVTNNWTDKVGTLKRYEKVGGKWMQLGGAIEIVVGDSGLGWGLGLHPLGVGEPRKTEGDGRSPAGVFRLVSAFGRGAPAVKTKMPWLETNESLGCVDDPASDAYNRILDVTPPAPPPPPASDGGVAGAIEEAEPVKPRFKSFEKLVHARDDMYDVAIIVDHNGLGAADSKVIPGRGSCIFLHIWRKKGRGTDGCTAMARWDLEKILEWLDPARKPVLVQLTKAELVKRKLPWALP